jgi:acetylornithine deacetylase/succinyl-diaminopimelate desuccinylase family protein
MPPVLDTLQHLVRINSVNSSYAGGPGEAELASWIESFFARHGLPTTRQTTVLPGRDNILARLPGRDRSRTLVLEAHMDTVAVAGMTIPPFDPVLRDGKLFGRGACDTKAGLAAMMHTLVDLKQAGITPPCDILLAAVVDEEYSYRGVVRLCGDLKADAAIVAEPTELRAVIASKGVLRWAIHVQGKAAHSSKPHLGINAIQHMRRVLEALDRDDARLATRSHPLVGQPTCSVGVIRGGVQVNLVPDACTIELDRRLLPGESAAAALAEYQTLLDAIPGITARNVEPLLLVDEALDTPADTAVVRTAAQTLASMGLNAEPCGVPYGSDASKLSRAGIPSIVFGPGSIDQAHAADESIETAQVLTALDFYRHFVLNYPVP